MPAMESVQTKVERLLGTSVAERLPGYGDRTVRRFLVTLNDGNTEYSACLAWLAMIADWFPVEPMYLPVPPEERK